MFRFLGIKPEQWPTLIGWSLVWTVLTYLASKSVLGALACGGGVFVAGLIYVMNENADDWAGLPFIRDDFNELSNRVARSIYGPAIIAVAVAFYTPIAGYYAVRGLESAAVLYGLVLAAALIIVVLRQRAVIKGVRAWRHAADRALLTAVALSLGTAAIFIGRQVATTTAKTVYLKSTTWLGVPGHVLEPVVLNLVLLVALVALVIGQCTVAARTAVTHAIQTGDETLDRMRDDDIDEEDVEDDDDHVSEKRRRRR